MTTKTARDEGAAPRARTVAPLREATFSGFPWPTKLLGPIVLAIPPLLYFAGLGDPQLLGVFYALAFIVVAAVFASWPALEAAPTRGLGFALITFAAVAGGAAALPLVRGIYPGAPLAEATLSKRDAAKPLAGVAAGPHQLVVHATFDESSKDVNAGYLLRLRAGKDETDIEGRFQSRHARGRAGRQSVDVVKAPLSWSRHLVTFPEAAPSVALLKADASIGDALEIRVYPSLPTWVLALVAGLLAVVAAVLATRLPSRDARMYYAGGLAALLLTGVIGSMWAWLGEPLLPLVGASFAGILGGYIVARFLLRLLRSLRPAA